MKNTSLRILLAIAALPLLSSCINIRTASNPSCVNACVNVKSSGVSVTETRNVTGFTAVTAATGIDVYITPAETFSVEVTADKNVMEYVRTELVGNELHIKYSSILSLNNTKVRTIVRLNCPKLETISATSGANIVLTEVFEGKKLVVDATSAADIEGAVRYEQIVVSVSSGADITLTGRCDNCDISATSGADVDTSALISKNVVVSATSGADAEVFALESLKARSSSGADITYHGDPTSTDIATSSGADISKGR